MNAWGAGSLRQAQGRLFDFAGRFASLTVLLRSG
jgi:hypothetical protein